MELEKKKVKFSHILYSCYYYSTNSHDVDVCWMMVARDRARFERRIAGIESDIAWIFEADHRNKMFRRLSFTCELL